MSTQDNSHNILQETARLRPDVEKLYRSSKGLIQFNMAAIASPFIGLSTAIISRDIVSLPVGVLLTSVASAALVQAARWQKAKLKETFKAVWDAADKATRNLTLGYLDETMNKKIGQTQNLIGREDFDLKDRHVCLQLGTTAFLAATSLPLSPVMYFVGTQTREFGNAQHIEIAARHTLKFYDHIKGPDQP